MKKQTLLAIILLAGSVVLAIVSYCVLPETVVTQLSLGSSNVTTMPKLAAVAIPFALGAGGAVCGLLTREENRSGSKCLLVSGVGILVFAIMLVVNLAGK